MGVKKLSKGYKLSDVELESATEAFFEAASMVRMVIDKCEADGGGSGSSSIDQKFQDVVNCLRPVQERLDIIGRILDK